MSCDSLLTWYLISHDRLPLPCDRPPGLLRCKLRLQHCNHNQHTVAGMTIGQQMEIPRKGHPMAKAISFKLLAICLCTLSSKGKHLRSMETTKGLSKAGGRDVVPIDQQIESSVASSSFQRIAIEQYTQSMSQVHRTPQTLPHGASIPPPPT